MKSTIPKFRSETEEAWWWFEHQDVLLDIFKTAEAEGRLGIGLAKKRAEANAKTPMNHHKLPSTSRE